jgi:bifunctional non-homologous end joining protein LigD
MVVKSQADDLPKAQMLANQLITSKTIKGYTVISVAHTQSETTDQQQLVVPTTSLAPAKERSPHLPQLLNPIDPLDAAVLRSDDNYWQQQKMDGDRRAVEITSSQIRGINRLGFYVPVNDEIKDSLKDIVFQSLIDGEIVQGILYAFDLLIEDGRDLRRQPYYVRLAQLEALQPVLGPAVQIVPTARTKEEKQRAFQAGEAAGVEGFVYKLKNAPYTIGRPNSGGPQLKLKFWKSASVIVTGFNAKNSFTMGVYDKGEVVSIGNCTGKTDIPLAIGDVVEVKYLYFQSALVQPECLQKRTDMMAEDCTLDQLVESGEKSALSQIY